jgi:hypothetical protein
MKKCAGFVLFGLAGIVLIWGIVTSVVQSVTIKTTLGGMINLQSFGNEPAIKNKASLDASGKIKMTEADYDANYGVHTTDEDKVNFAELNVKDESYEVISAYEYMQRVIKHQEIILRQEKRIIDAMPVETDAEQAAKKQADADCRDRVLQVENMKEHMALIDKDAFQESSRTFFLIYLLPAIGMLLAGLIIKNRPSALTAD